MQEDLKKQGQNFSRLHAGVPEDRILGPPVLFTLYTADIQTSDDIFTATYAEDTVIMVARG